MCNFSLIFFVVHMKFNNNNLQFKYEGIHKHTGKYKLICLWTRWNNKNGWNIPRISYPDYLAKIKCPETRCRFILPDKKFAYAPTDYDAIVFNGFDLKIDDPIPVERKREQLYVFVSWEPPMPWWLDIVNFNISYNYTSK